MAKVKNTTETTPTKRRTAINPEARESQLISYAYDLVEQRLLDGTASAQETVHFLKLATQEQRKKEERMELENQLIKAKTEQIQSQKHIEELYAEAISAMREYGGKGGSDEDEYDDEY